MNEPVADNQAHRYRRLAFYAEDVEHINQQLSNFMRKSQARAALLVDKEGHLVAKQGYLAKLDTTSLSALVAGSFASTREVARLLGEPEFKVLSHQGKEQSIHITLIGERTLQVVVFDSQVMPGMIQELSKQLAGKVNEILIEISKREPREEDTKQMDGFSSEMKDHLDSLFGDL